MELPIYHNLEARAKLIALMCATTPTLTSAAATESVVNLTDALIARCLRTGTDAIDETAYGGVIMVETILGNDDQDYLHIEYLFNCTAGTNHDYDNYRELPKEEDDPQLITGMIADEGF